MMDENNPRIVKVVDWLFKKEGPAGLGFLAEAMLNKINAEIENLDCNKEAHRQLRLCTHALELTKEHMFDLDLFDAD